MIATRHKQSGFALPTILIASVVMLIVLVSAVSATASVRSALDGQYYNRLAREAAESGVARASACLQASAFVVQWSSANNLRPNTTCSGGAACTNVDSCFVMKSGNIRTTFSVGEPTSSTSSQLVSSVGKVELVRPSNGSVIRTYTYTASGRVGIDVNLTTVTFGYVGPASGAFFATISADGKMNGVGYNGNGMLGNGTTNSTLTPTEFQLPGSERAVAIFTNFVSQGYDLFAVTDNGKVYGAGLNDKGQLGDGTATSRSTPVQFGLPAGVKATSVASSGRATFVFGNDNKIYATGQCLYGLIGTNDSMVSGCSNRLSYKAVVLPTPNLSDKNTLPTNNLVTDANTAFVRMQGGRVYGWGQSQWGQLANGYWSDHSAVPIQIGTYGNAGQPKALDLAFDGDTIYVVDDQGKVKASGRGDHGQLGGAGVSIINPTTGKCLDNKNQDGLNIQLYTCNNTAAQKFIFRSDKSIYNPNTNKCLDNNNADGVNIRLWTCNGAYAQKFTLREDDTIYNSNPNTGLNRCLDNTGYDGVRIGLYTCSGTSNEEFKIDAALSLVDFNLPASAGKAIKVETDQWSVSILTDTGEVWSAGRDDVGQLGSGSTSFYRPYPVKFVLPAGVKAVDVSVSAYYASGVTFIANTFVIGDDGKVYGAGNNQYGQIGDGTTTNRPTPVAMDVIDGVGHKAKYVQSGGGTTIVLTYGKRLYTVGNNNYGQLGDGTTTNSVVPKANKYTNVLPLAIF